MSAGPVHTGAVGTGTVETGLEHLAADGFAQLKGCAVAVLTHPAAILPDATHAVEALLRGGVEIRALLGPEHGFRGSAQAGFSESETVDAATGIPVVDTYLADVPEVAARLAELGADTVVVDLQNSGSRFYTYESSMYDAIGAAATARARVVVLDRPNPIGGVAVDGPVLDPAYASFVGRAPIAVRHGMTMGELARLFAQLLAAPEPDVVPMRGWRRAMLFAQTGLPWVPPSPNLPTPDSALCYPGTCLFEGTDVSEGRGTTTPFELLGAPWIDATLARELRAAQLPGVAVREAYFSPVVGLHSEAGCCGVQLHVTDPLTFDPLRVALHMLTSIQRHWPERLGFREQSFDLLCGSSRIREAVLAGAGADEIADSWREEAARFRADRGPHLVYELE
jgi:uncharacterized protein YbbC (DUF1343 family)